ncbi:GerAB/ArcD/ProY family transporter [Terribacillus sp. FSL K6-0262]|uniref:GerAB/ArcD/ProY family transporter n=1 Tax=Terribacillus sp. FSL K6-0262 TaxID=2921447 RepID=UPI0030EC3FD3
MRLNNKPLRVRELLALIFLLIGLKGGDTTPALFADQAQNAIWLAPIISFLFLLGPFLLLMSLLKKYENYNLVELIFHLLGKKAGTALALLLMICGYLSMFTDMRNVVEEINYLYFPNSPTLVIYVLFLGICLIVAHKGLETIGSLAWALLPIIVLTVISVLIVDIRAAELLRIFPIFGGGVGTVLREGISKSAAFMEIFLITIAYSAFHHTKYFRLGIFWGGGLSAILIITFYAIYTMLFDYNSINNIAFLYQESTEIIPLRHFFTNISTFFMVGWMFSNFIRFTIFLYLLSWIFGAIFEIKRFEGLLLPMGFIAMMVSLIPPSFVVNEMIFREKSLQFMTPIFFLFPFLLWGASYWRDRKT